MTLRRDWADAREKIETEGICRVCAAGWGLETAHVIGRARDERKRGASIAYVHPNSVIPMCREHHRAYDAHALDILGVLSLEEQVQAVRDAGGLALAMRRICGRNVDQRDAA